MFGPDLAAAIKSVGYLGILISVILENGVLIFFFMPSDSLLFVAGFLASQNYLDIRIVIPVCFVGAVLGYMVGYFLGQKTASKLRGGRLNKYIDEEELKKAEEMYKRYAMWALVFARFFPIRAFVSFFAGATEIPYRTFMLYNVIGAIIWSVSLPLIGFYFGKFLAPEDLDAVFITIFVAFVACVAGLGILMHLKKKSMQKKAAAIQSKTTCSASPE